MAMCFRSIGAAGRAHRSLAPVVDGAAGREHATGVAVNEQMADEPVQRWMCIVADGGIRTPAYSLSAIAV